MAGVLNALASYVTKMLADMARDEVAMMIGVTGKIDDLSVKLRDLKNFLADADRRMITDESVHGWVEELKHAMYQATDILDLCQLKAMEKGPSKDMGCLNPLLFCMRNPLHAHDIGSRIKALNEKLDEICTRGRSFDFIKLEAYQDRKTTRPLVVNRKTDPLLERSAVVGEKIEEDTRMLVEMLTKDVAQESCSIMVFAIVGVGGIGKTTLSKKVFNNESIQGKFSKKIWLSITQEFNEVDLLRTAITAAEGDMPGPGGGTEDKALLVPALASAIKDKKFFLVLDDMWGDNEWNNLLKAPFSHGTAASRVLVTTRNEIIARGMKAVSPYHHVDKLDTNVAWSLLKKQVLTTELSEPAVDMLKDIGFQIIEKCDGLPLAIKVMGGLLCQKEKERHAWEKVLNDSIWSVSQMPEKLNYAIHLSYEDLSPCLKQCFLHFSLKPKKTILSDSEYVSMWIGEGFVHGDLDSLEVQGIEYHKELILRNLIEPDTSYPGRHVCNMHDVVHSFAHFMTRDKSLVAHNREIVSRKFSLQRFLRLSIETSEVESDELEWRSLQEQNSLRSMILIGNFNIRPGDSLITFSSLRTLHVESGNFAPLLESLHLLKHLRYLAVKKCNGINSLPEDIHKLKFLQHINFEGCESLVKLTDSIVKLQDLRFIDLDQTHVTSIPRGFHALTKLRTMYGFPAHMDGEWCSLEDLGPISQLRCIRLVGLQNVPAASFAKKASLGEKFYLSMLGLDCNSRLGNDGSMTEIVSVNDQRLIEEVFNELCPPPCIEDIRMLGYYGVQLPRWMMSTSMMVLENLRILILMDMACCTHLPDGLCQLPCLKYLLASRAPAIKYVGPEFVHPNNHRYHSSSQVVPAFPTLQEMDLAGLLEWEEWEWKDEVQAMPALDKLSIKKCKLRCIPPGLASHARCLKKLTIWSVKGLNSLENFVSVVELDLYDIPYLTRISNFPKLLKLKIDRCPMVESLQEMNAVRRLVLTVFYSEKQLPAFLQTVNPSHLLLDCCFLVLTFMAFGQSSPEWEKFSHIQRVETYSDDEGIEKRWHVFYTKEPYSMETNIDLQGLREAAGLSSGHEGGADVDNSQYENEEERMAHDQQLLLDIQQYLIREAEADVENNQDENEEERMGHDPQELLDESLPAGSGGLLRSTDEDEDDLNSSQDKSEVELENRKEE